jgi:hypothetical protein
MVLIARRNERGCTHRCAALKTTPFSVDFELGGFANRTHPKAKNITAISFEPRFRVTGGHERTADCQDRRAGFDRVAGGNTDICAEKLGADDCIGRRRLRIYRWWRKGFQHDVFPSLWPRVVARW